MDYENNLLINSKEFPICQQLENSLSVSTSNATCTMQNNGEAIDANKEVRCQYVSHTRLQCSNLVSPAESDAFHGFCSSHKGYIHRRQKLFLKVQNVFDPSFKEELANPDSNAFELSDDEDETLIPQLKWPNFEENMYCDDELNDDEDNPLRNAGVYTQKEAIREYVSSLQRQINAIQEFRSLLSEKYRRLQRRFVKLRKSRKKHTQFPLEKVALFHAVRKYRDRGSRCSRYQRHYSEKNRQREESSIDVPRIDKELESESESATDDQIIASIVNDLVQQVDMAQSRSSSHTTEIEVVIKTKSTVGRPKKQSKSSKYEVEKYYVDGILQKDKLPAHILEILEKFEESTIYERDRLNELRTAVLEQIQRPAMIPTTHPSSTTFESLLPTIPRPTVHEETLSDEGLLGEISPTISKKVTQTSLSTIPSVSQYRHMPAIQMATYKPYQPYRPLSRLYSQQPVRMQNPITSAGMEILRPSRPMLSKLPSSYQKPISSIEPPSVDLDEFSDDQFLDEEEVYEDEDDHELYTFELSQPRVPTMQIRNTPISVSTPTSVQQHRVRPPQSATYTCARVRPYKAVPVSGPGHIDYDSRYTLQVQEHFASNFGQPRRFPGSTTQRPIFQNQRRFLPVMTYQPTTAITINTSSANPISVGQQRQFFTPTQQRQQRSSIMTGTKRQYQPPVVKPSVMLRHTQSQSQSVSHTDIAISSPLPTALPSKSNARNKPNSQQLYLEYLKRQKITPPSKSSVRNVSGENDDKEQNNKETGPGRASSQKLLNASDENDGKEHQDMETERSRASSRVSSRASSRVSSRASSRTSSRVSTQVLLNASGGNDGKEQQNKETGSPALLNVSGENDGKEQDKEITEGRALRPRRAHLNYKL